jgi:putative transposase
MAALLQGPWIPATCCNASPGPPGHGYDPLRFAFPQSSTDEIRSRWDHLFSSLEERFPKAVALMHQAREDVLAFPRFPMEHWRRIWSASLLVHVNEKF